jgi:hypothetical protein
MGGIVFVRVKLCGDVNLTTIESTRGGQLFPHLDRPSPEGAPPGNGRSRPLLGEPPVPCDRTAGNSRGGGGGTPAVPPGEAAPPESGRPFQYTSQRRLATVQKLAILSTKVCASWICCRSWLADYAYIW